MGHPSYRKRIGVTTLKYMNSVTHQEIKEFADQEFARFYEMASEQLDGLSLTTILEGHNPYYFQVKKFYTVGKLIQYLLAGFFSKPEDEFWKKYFRDLAVFISSKTYGGVKSSSTGIDFEFSNKGCRYVVSVKSGPNWGNSSQQRKQQEDFQKAIKVLRQSRRVTNVQAILGICYGKTKPNFLRGYWKLVGQSFWYFISGNENLYTDIVEPLGHKAKERNAEFDKKRAALANRLAMEFMGEFCNKDGSINWDRLVEFNSGNLKKGEFPLKVF